MADINPIILICAVLTAFSVFTIVLARSLKNPIIPFILLILIYFWILFGQKMLAPVGLDFKPHAGVFLLALLTSGYFLVTKFNELWVYKPFRYLFGFLILSTLYAFFYKTDFRSSNYIDLWIQNNLGLRFSAIRSGVETLSRNFESSETRFLVYLIGIAPLCAFLTGFMSFWQKADFNDLKNRLYLIVSLISAGMFAYYIVLAISILLGTSSVMLMANRLVIDGGFTGGSFEAPFLLMMAAFYFLLNKNYEQSKLYVLVKSIIAANITILSLMIILGIKKGTLISLGLAGIVAFIVITVVKYHTHRNFTGEESPKEEVTPDAPAVLTPVMFFAPVALFTPLLLIQTGFAEDLVYNITNRFSSTSTFDVRMINWEMYVTHWLNHLDFFKVMFGHGIDTSREITFFLSAMHPDPSYQQPHIHNLYLEMFYNYGLMAFLFFLPFFFILRKNLKDIFVEPPTRETRIFNVLSIAMLVYFFTFYMAESPSMIAIMLVFVIFGFLEGVRISMGHGGRLPKASKFPV